MVKPSMKEPREGEKENGALFPCYYGGNTKSQENAKEGGGLLASGGDDGDATISIDFSMTKRSNSFKHRNKRRRLGRKERSFW